MVIGMPGCNQEIEFQMTISKYSAVATWESPQRPSTIFATASLLYGTDYTLISLSFFYAATDLLIASLTI